MTPLRQPRIREAEEPGPRNESSGARQARGETPPRGRSLLREYAESIVIAVVLALVVRTFVVQAFEIPSGSMLPTLQIGDHILVNKFLYRFRPIHRGDIVVFKYPKDESRDFIKRVIGLPGETLEVRGTQVYIDGRPLREPYAVYAPSRLAAAMRLEHFGPVQIPPGYLFMMGDNRDDSLDSRSWGFLDERKVEGKALLVYFSLRTADMPYRAVVPNLLHLVVHPGLVRWDRIGRLVD